MFPGEQVIFSRTPECFVIVRHVFGTCLARVWHVFGTCLARVWRVFGACIK